MALECLAILGNKNEPLYVCTPQNDVELADSESDAFGFLDPAGEGSRSLGFSMRHEFMMHAALDRLEETLGSPKYFDLVKMQRGTKWMGSLLPMEDCEVYGYVTPSNVKILALVKRESVVHVKRRKESDIKLLFNHVHDCYVRYTMNPFTKLGAKIQKPCTDFEIGIQEAIANFGQSLTEEPQD